MLKKKPATPGMKRIFLCGSPCSADSGCKPGAAKWTKASTVHGSCWNLLEYLIAFRHRDISPDELVRTLWHDDEIGNPSSALKNLVYRIRTIMTSQGIPFAKNMILFRRGTYSWNNALPTTVDTEEFERLIREADEKDGQAAEQLKLYLLALSYYKGDLLPKSSFEEWVVPLSTYYHSLYVRCVGKTVRLLTDAGRYQEISDIAQQAIVIDQFEEIFATKR